MLQAGEFGALVECRTVIDGYRRCVHRAAVKAAEGPAWDDFPTGLRTGIEGYLTGLSASARNKADIAGHRVIAGLITSKRRNESKKLLQLTAGAS
jgi:hypothetical protein